MTDRRSGRASRRAARIVAVVLVAAFAGMTATSNGALAVTAPSPTFGPVIDTVGYDPQNTCDPVAKPGVLAFRAFAERYFGAGDLGIATACRRGDISEHHEGRAWDAAFNYYNLSQRAKAQRLITWLLATDAYGNVAANAKRLGIMYMIWDKHIWGAYSADEGWRPYYGPDPHTSHIHLSFTWDGALRQTTWYAAGKSFMDPYQPWTDTTTGPTDGTLSPILTVHPVDPPIAAVTKPPSKPAVIVHKVYDELHGSVISAVHYSH